ncbi:hypothetical protein AB0B63_18440 [Micromonospora sp. NPDC049081]|uniref:hypothetical protein n=1 Tax=Micromonospora sp. NPDC049081 TaxID=3155150 RepID=UPI0033CF071C
MTTDIDLDAIETRTSAADPGPWTAHPDGLVWSTLIGDPVSGSVEQPNAEFIAHARTDVPALLAIAKAARYEEGAGPCMDGECEHAAEDDENAPEDATCPLIVTRYATADDAIERDNLLAELQQEEVAHQATLRNQSALSAKVQEQKVAIERLIGFRNATVAERQELADRVKAVREFAEKTNNTDLLAVLGDPHPSESRPPVVFDRPEAVAR